MLYLLFRRFATKGGRSSQEKNAFPPRQFLLFPLFLLLAPAFLSLSCRIWHWLALSNLVFVVVLQSNVKP